MLEVQKFLSTRTFGDLAREWGVYARCDKTGRKFSLNYDQLEYTPGHYPTEQCRGLILGTQAGVIIPNKDGKVDESFCPGVTTLMAYPFDKFYNEEQVDYASKLDWSDPSLRIEDKMDGTLAILYWDHIQNRWAVSTRSVPDADLPVDGWPDLTFASLFTQAMNQTMGPGASEMISKLPKGICYMFELTTQYNRIFVNYGHEPKVTLIGARDMHTLQEWDPDVLIRTLKVYFPRPTRFPVRNSEDVHEFVNGREPDQCEGVVLTDSKFNRIKIKNIRWVVANATKTSLGTSPRNLMRYVLSGISDDITAMLPPDLKEKLFEMESGIKALIKDTDESFAKWKEEATDRKHFAEIVLTKGKWKMPLFKMYEGRYASSGDYLKELVLRDKLGDGSIDDLIKFAESYSKLSV